MQKLIAPLNICLTLLVIAALALIASDLAGHKLSGLFPRQTQKISSAPASATAVEDLTAFAPILEKGLFGKATQGQLTPIVHSTAGPQTAPVVAQGELLLLGTVIGSFRETFALIQKTSSHEERVFRLGDEVYSMGPLVSVKKEVAEILVGGKKIKVLTPTAVAAETAAPSISLPLPPPGGLASQVGSGSYVIDQRALNAALDNIGQAMTDARLIPSVKDGKVEGFRTLEVKPQGIFGTVGIKNGDILLRVNDFAINSPEKAIQSFASLKGQSRIKLDLIRDGQPTSLNYDIR